MSRSIVPVFLTRLTTLGLTFVLVASPLAEAQVWKRVTQTVGCGAGAVVGAKVGEKAADYEAKRLGLSPQEAARQKRAYEIGLALAFCAGGAAIAGTTYSHLSKRGKEAREKELQAAVQDASPRVYKDPENPRLEGRLTPQPSFTQGNEECRVIEDHLADGSQTDDALIKYCRQPPDGEWKAKR